MAKIPFKQLQQSKGDRKAMAKFGTQTKYTCEENGLTYVFQHPGTRNAVKMRDRSKVDGNWSEEKYYGELMQHVIFTEDLKSVTWEHFDEYGGFSDVIKEAAKFCSK